MNGLQSLEEWRTYFGYPQGTMLGFVNAAQNLLFCHFVDILQIN